MKRERKVDKNICRKKQGIAEEGNTCLQTPGTCESCPDWWNRRGIKAYPYKDLSQIRVCSSCGKKTTKRKNTLPAPVCFYVGSTPMSLCMKCAKKASSCLDIAIERIERKYVRA